MRELVESILTGNNVEAQKIFESRLDEIKEKKLYEAKRNLAAQMDEIFGGLTKREIEAKRKAGYRRASEVLGDPEKSTKVSAATKKYRATLKKKKVSEETLDEIKLAGDVAGSLSRKITAAGLKLGKKYLSKDFRKTYMQTRTSQMRAPKSSSETPRDISVLGSNTDKSKSGPGVIKRNVNTLLGRKPGYVKPETPEDEKGGRAGKAVRLAGKGVGKVFGTWNKMVHSGMSGNLE